MPVAVGFGGTLMNAEKEVKIIIILGLGLLVGVAAFISMGYGTDALILFFLAVFAAASYLVVELYLRVQRNQYGKFLQLKRQNASLLTGLETLKKESNNRTWGYKDAFRKMESLANVMQDGIEEKLEQSRKKEKAMMDEQSRKKEKAMMDELEIISERVGKRVSVETRQHVNTAAEKLSLDIAEFKELSRKELEKTKEHYSKELQNQRKESEKLVKVLQRIAKEASDNKANAELQREINELKKESEKQAVGIKKDIERQGKMQARMASVIEEILSQEYKRTRKKE